MYTLRETRNWNQPMLWLAVAMAVTAVGAIGGLVFDDRMLTGMPIWAKPLKFAVSIAIYAVTWSWMASLITTGARTVRWASGIAVVSLVVEMVVIVGQVLRGTTSHFNNSTELNGLLWKVMGGSIAVVWIGTLALTVLLLRSEIADAASKWAIRLGALLSLAGLALGGLMTAPTSTQLAAEKADYSPTLGAHSVGVPDGGPGLPILGWSTTGGDLRIPHFVGMHALQLLPLLAVAIGLLATRWSVLQAEQVRVRLVFVAAAGYAGLVGLVTWQALRGQSIIAPDGWTLAALGALVVGIAVGVAWAVLARNTYRAPRSASRREHAEVSA